MLRRDGKDVIRQTHEVRAQTLDDVLLGPLSSSIRALWPVTRLVYFGLHLLASVRGKSSYDRDIRHVVLKCFGFVLSRTTYNFASLQSKSIVGLIHCFASY